MIMVIKIIHIAKSFKKMYFILLPSKIVFGDDDVLWNAPWH